MKTKMKVGLIAASLAFVAPMWANAATITFTGEVAASTCNITINGSTVGNVLMPTVAASDLAAAGEDAGLTTFTITAEGCEQDTSDRVVTTSFLGQYVNAATGTLGNQWTGADAATNVGIQLTQNSDGSDPIMLETGPTTVPAFTIPAGATGGSYTYGARYLAVGGAATVGMVQAIAEYEVFYQ